MAANTGDVVLGLGVELLILGIATGVAGISDDVGSIMVVFMIGLLIAWIMSHAFVLQRITGPTPKGTPNLFSYLRGKGVIA